MGECNNPTKVIKEVFGGEFGSLSNEFRHG